MRRPLTGPRNLPWHLLCRHWPVLVLLIVCMLLALAGEPARTLLRYDRTGLQHGEIWRLVTGSFVHLGWSHLLEDMLGALLLWLLFEEWLAGQRFLWVLLAGSLGVGAGLYLGSPDVQWYVGISGALDTVWAVGALCMLRDHDRFGVWLGGFLVLKLLYEQTAGPLPFSASATGGAVVVDAHLYGAFTGAVLGSVWVRLRPHRIMRRSVNSENEG